MKSDRHNRIIELVTENDIETQEELAGYLKADGYDVTQATVSRDIRKLGLTKVPGTSGRSKYAVAGSKEKTADKQYIHALKDTVISVDSAMNLIIIKTESGMAMAVAAAVDALEIDGIVGSIAGDDTIMCAAKSIAAAEKVTETIKDQIRRNG